KNPLKHVVSLSQWSHEYSVTQVASLHQEVENYRAAMRKMAEDIILLRTQIGALEAENSQLRSDLSLHQDLGQDLLSDTDIDVMTKAEMCDRISSLKFKLASETSKVASQRDRIQQLQNELIKKNDSEKELLKLQRIHRQQEQLQQHQNHSAKVASLEATVKQQEKVIEKMEKALDSKLRERNRQSGDKRLVKDEIESALAAENARLREELERTRQQPPTVVIQQSAQVLLHIQATINLEENSRLWGRQKQEMLTKLSEHSHGFVHTTVLRNVSSDPQRYSAHPHAVVSPL
uniref:Uncharacterized protein n=1 Tax=Anabas testudineus TaxID=64144 RepID=A0A3Q1I5X0_ANATE